LKVILVDNIQDVVVKSSVGVVIDMWLKLAFTLVSMSSFMLLYEFKWLQKWSTSLRAYGKMGLTMYIHSPLLEP